MNQKQALIRAIEITDEILGLLDSAEFDLIENLEIERQPLIKKAFSESVESVDRIRAEHLQNLNTQVVTKLTLFKSAVMAQQAQIRNAARATKAYQQNIPNFE